MTDSGGQMGDTPITYAKRRYERIWEIFPDLELSAIELAKKNLASESSFVPGEKAAEPDELRSCWEYD